MIHILIFNPDIPRILRDKTIVLTGHTGYVGGHLLQTIIKTNMNPVVIGRKGKKTGDINPKVTAIDWTDVTELGQKLSRFSNTVVINVAGYFANNHNEKDIIPLVHGNLQFPTEIFEAMRVSGHRNVVNIGTSWEYTKGGCAQPKNLYAHLKHSNSKILEWYCKEFEFRAINIKLNDTYGGNDTRQKLLPYIKECILHDQTAKLGNPEQPLNLLHIVDVQSGLLHAAARTLSKSSRFNQKAFLLGPETIKIGELINRISSVVEKDINVKFECGEGIKQNINEIWTDGPPLTNWAPKIALADGLKEYFNR